MKILLGVVACMFATGAFAGVQDCDFLLKRGIKNELSVFDEKTSRKITTSELCSNRQSVDSSGISIKYAGAEVGADKRSSLAQAMCDRKATDDNLQEVSQRLEGTIDHGL